MVNCRQRLAAYGAGRGEGGETGGAGLRPWALVKPRHDTVDIDRGGDGVVYLYAADNSIGPSIG